MLSSSTFRADPKSLTVHGINGRLLKSLSVSSSCETRLQGSMVTKTVPCLELLILIAMVPCRGVSWRELSIRIVLLISIHSEMRDNLLSLSALKIILRGLTQLNVL